MPIMDCRGANRGVKISDDDYNLIVNKLPTNESHQYGPNQWYIFLTPGMTFS